VAQHRGHADVRLPERLVDEAVVVPEVEQDVVRSVVVDARGLRCERCLRIHRRREWLVVDADPGHRILGEVPVGGRHQRHRLTDEAHAVSGERGLRGR
jgi:hypothetical protein